MFKKILATLTVLASLSGATWLNNPDRSYELRAVTEIGFLNVPKHTIQFGRNGTTFDYVKEGNQNILFPFNRLSVELHLKPRHTLVFLYQPIDVRTETFLENPLVIDTDTFPAGTPMNLRYGFDFYRISWQYDFLADPDRELAIGVSGQIRDASISFASQDGRNIRVYNDLGPVPILRFRGRLPVTTNTWVAAEIDGFYAQGKFVTGSNNVESSFKGSILDASLRYGMNFTDWLDGFVNLRYLGGGAEGQQSVPENRGDGYTSNWLNTVTLSLGFITK